TATMLTTLQKRISQRLSRRRLSLPLFAIAISRALCRRRVLLDVLLDRDHSGYHPLVPRLVDLRLEVVDVVVGEVREAALLVEVLAHRPALEAAVGDVASAADQRDLAVLHLPERPDAGLDRGLAELVGEHRV